MYIVALYMYMQTCKHDTCTCMYMYIIFLIIIVIHVPNLVPLHGFFQQHYDVFMFVAPGNVEGWAESTQAELVGKVDDDLYAL